MRYGVSDCNGVPYFVYTSDRFGGLLIYQTAGWVCAKGSKYFWHIFYLDECCIFIYRYEEKKIFILFLL